MRILCKSIWRLYAGSTEI